ncbi:MAG: hypothetical protein IKZ47_01275 [Clostridia bacterium]|nr:hypothetical protein [Clostridia bacterium]
MDNSVHEGHRERVRAEFIQNGFGKDTPPRKLLEFLLFYCVSRRDTAPTAYALLSRFGSLANVLDAPLEDIAAVDGMSRNSALLLKSIMPIASCYLHEKKTQSPNFNGLEDIGEFVLTQYMGTETERIGLVSLTTGGKLLAFEFIGEGDISSVGVSFRDIIGRLIGHNANAAVLAHNHPSGVALPSLRDTAVTESLAATLKNVGICLVDHVIVGSGDYISMAQSKEYAHIFGTYNK